MICDDDNLKAFYQGFLASQKPETRAGCPATDDIVDSFDNSASRSMKKKVVDHIAGCPLCREEFMLLLESRKQPTELSPSKNTMRKYASPKANFPMQMARPIIWQYLFLLLGLSLGVASALLLVHQKEELRVQRGNEASISLTYPKPNQPITKPFIFRWEEYPASEYYILEIFDESLLLIWTSDKILENRLPIQPEVYIHLNLQKPYYWTVTAYAQDSIVMESTLARFMVIKR